MSRFTHSLIAILMAATPAILGQGTGSSSYQITQITSDPVAHESPSINDNGDIVWSQQVGGYWQIFLLPSGATTPSLLPGQQANHNNQFPAIDDAGDVMYLKDGVGQGVALADILNHGGTESIIEFSSRNMLTGQHRDAGMHFGISSNGTTISYYDFLQFGTGPRRFDISGMGQLPGDFTGKDFPDINAQGIYAYIYSGSIYLSTSSSPIAVGTEPRLADGANPEVVYIIGAGTSGTVVSSVGGSVDTGSWADVNNSGTVVYQKTIAGVDQIFLATTGPHISLGCPAATGTVTIPYASAFVATGGTGLYSSFSLNSGSLPLGLTLNSSGGIAGTPTTPATYSFTGIVIDSAGHTATSGTCTIAIMPPPCTYSLSYSSRNFPKEGGPAAVDVLASGTSCPVYASSPVDWISFNGGLPQYGSGTVYYSVAANSAAARAAGITVAFQSLAITQDGSCDTERQTIIAEYVQYQNAAFALGIVPFGVSPDCSLFTQGFASFDVNNDSSWALVRSPMVSGFSNWAANNGSSLTITSAYRTPQHNSFGGSPGSRHVFGDAIDVSNPQQSNFAQTRAQWLLLYRAAQAAGANWLEGQTSSYPCRCTPTKCDCVHADWRNTPGDYLQ